MSRPPRAPTPAPDLPVAVDAAAVAAVSVLICTSSGHPALMTAAVPGIILIRFAALWAAGPGAGGPMPAEAVFFLACALVGGANDWNTVSRWRVYEYTVPHGWGASTIPLWMLLYWGMVLRFVARLSRWTRLVPPRGGSDDVRFGPWRTTEGWVKVAVELALVAATRLAIRRFYLDPILSWLPFLAALAAFAALIPLGRRDQAMLALVLVGGPAVEVLYINVGHLHRYHLGWVGGVPLWIVLWWGLAALVWRDISFRMERAIVRALPR